MIRSLAPRSVDRPLDGHFFEDFSRGQRFEHANPRTLTEGDASLHLALTGARQPVHSCVPLAHALGHRAAPLDDLLVFHVAFGNTVADVSYNAVANLGYADVRFLAPVYAGDTLVCESEVIGTKPNSSGKTGVVYVHSRAFNLEGTEVLSWVRWVMVARREPADPTAPASGVVPALHTHVAADRLVVPPFLDPSAIEARATGGTRLWDDYTAGEMIDHPGGATVEEAEHVLATRLYQNTARVHFDAFRAKDAAFGKRLVYGGHVISLCRGLSHDGLENAFAIAAIHGGSHANPVFAGDTVYCRHVVVAQDEIPRRKNLGALRLRMIGVKNAPLESIPPIEPGVKHESVVLDLDYSVLIPRRQS
ncbi:MAG TPA: MaoC family dehydratase [Usitatibacter sp.]|nr:MaoC family dehydratase [Usitatibacter sp.]